MFSYIEFHLSALIYALILLLIGMTAVSFFKKRMYAKAAASQDPTLNAFLVNCASLTAIVLIGIMTLTVMGVPTTALITVLGASTLAIGLALKEFLSNVAAGFVLIFLRPFKVGDTVTVVNNVTGKVVEINLFVTHLDTQSNEAVFVPNNQLVNSAIINKTRYASRQLDLRFTFDHAISIAQVKNLLEATAKSMQGVHPAPPPSVAVAELTENTLVLLLRVWVDSEMMQKVQFELIEKMKAKLDEAGIQMMTPHMNITLRNLPAALAK